MEKSGRIIKTLIIIPAVLLCLSLIALAGVIIYRRTASPSGDSGTVVIPDNFINENTEILLPAENSADSSETEASDPKNENGDAEETKKASEDTTKKPDDTAKLPSDTAKLPDDTKPVGSDNNAAVGNTPAVTSSASDIPAKPADTTAAVTDKNKPAASDTVKAADTSKNPAVSETAKAAVTSASDTTAKTPDTAAKDTTTVPMTTFVSKPGPGVTFIPLPAVGQSALVLSLHKYSPEANEPFDVRNMFPGDVETKYYCVRVSYRGTITVNFRSNIRPGYEKLAEVLKCKVTFLNQNSVLYDGIMRDMPASLPVTITAGADATADLYYEITVYLDTSVGNEYQNKELVCDFVWWAEADNPVFPWIPIIPDVTTAPGPAITTGPDTTTASPDVTTAPGETTAPDGTTAPDVTVSPGTTSTDDTTSPVGTGGGDDTTGGPDVTTAPKDPVDSTGTLIPPQTGDNTPLTLIAFAFGISFILIILLLASRKKRDEEGKDA